MIEFKPEQLFLVTGASSGVGRATALLLNRCGATVICSGRDTDRLSGTISEAAYPERMFAEVRDLGADLADHSAWLQRLAKKYGKLTGLVNSAGITWNAPLSFYNLAKVNQVFDICCHAPMLLSATFCGRHVNAGPGSAIVNIAAGAAIDPNPGQGAYAAAKAALVTGSRCLAKEAAPNVRVNCISPGLLTGKMLEETAKQLGPAFLEREKAAYPLGIGVPEDIANLGVFLLSEAARWITGQNFPVTGGR